MRSTMFTNNNKTVFHRNKDTETLRYTRLFEICRLFVPFLASLNWCAKLKRGIKWYKPSFYKKQKGIAFLKIVS